jgi:uncharacterized protein (TIGR03437 family)
MYLKIAASLILAVALSQASTVGQTSTSIAITSSVNPSALGQAVTLSALVTPAQATGEVTFYDGTAVLGTSALLNGNSVISAILLAPGARSLTARYSGAGEYLASASAVLRQTVNAASATTFAPAVNYPTANAINPHLAVADFNGDGHLDIVTNNYTVLTGAGDGTFRVAGTYTSDSDAYAVATGDFNGDGKPDFAAARYDGNVGIWLSKGDGTFEAPVLYPVGAAPRDIAVGDFNNDGIPDIAVASRQGQGIGIGILLGVGDGTFKPVVTYLAGRRQTALAIADFNGDGNADIVAVDSDDISQNVTVLLGVGDGTFRVAYQTDAAFPVAVATGDFNNDGRPDFAVIDWVGGAVSLFLGNGDGTFNQQASLPAPGSGANNYGLAVGDFDGDGNQDIALVNSSGPRVSAYLGMGDGTFRGPINFATGSAAAGAVIAAEFNGDGRTDLAVADSSNLHILLGGVGDFPAVTTTALPDGMGGVPYSVALSATGGTTPYKWSLSVGTLPSGLSLGTDGTIAGTPNASYPITAAFTVVASGANGAGFRSSQNLSMKVATAFLITANVYIGEVGVRYPGYLQASGGTPPYRNWTVTSGSLPPGLTLDATSGKFVGSPSTAGTFASTITVNDSSGLTSLPANISIFVEAAPAIMTQYLPEGFTGVPYYEVLAATGGFPAYTWKVTAGVLPPGLSLDPSAGVISGTPASVAGSPYNFTISVDDGSAGSTKAFTIPIVNAALVSMTMTSSANPSPLGTALTLTAQLTPSTLSGNVTFWDGTAQLGAAAIQAGTARLTTTLRAPGAHKLRAQLGAVASAVESQAIAAIANGSLQPPVNYAAGNIPVNGVLTPITVADVNGDGIADLVTMASVMLGNGDGTFRAPIVHPVPIAPISLALADFNEDGIPDIAVVSQTDFAVYLGNGDGTFAAGRFYQNSSFGFLGHAVAADFNHDGHADLLITSSPAQLYPGNGDGTFRQPLSVAMGDYPVAIAAGDFNGDGIPDVAWVDALSLGKINILIGNGDGTFQPAVTYPVTASATYPLVSILACDLNNDGNTDLAVYGPSTDRVSVLLGRGDGTFRASTDYLIGGSAGGVGMDAGDFNGDGIPDLVLTGESGSAVTFLLGNGDGSFRPGESFAAGANGSGPLVTGDFNNDGHPDIAVVAGADTVNVLLGSSVAGANQLTLSPPSVNANLASGGAATSTTVTLTYRTTVPGAPTFTGTLSTNQGTNWIGISPSTGTMSQVSYTGSLYAYAAQVNVRLDPQSTSGNAVYRASVLFSANGAEATLPVLMSTGTPPVVTAVVNAASAGQDRNFEVSPGSYITIYGAGLGGYPGISSSQFPLPATLDGTQVTIGGIALPLTYVSSGQVNGIVPQELGPNNSYQLNVDNGWAFPAPVTVLLKELQPGIYTLNESGSGAGIVTNAISGELIGTSNPAHVSDYLTVYSTGLGPLQGPNGEVEPADGAAAPDSPLFRTIANVTATIGGIGAPVLFSGLSPESVGLYQVNVQVPAGVGAGNAVPLVLTAADSLTGATAQSNTVTIVVQ